MYVSLFIVSLSENESKIRNFISKTTNFKIKKNKKDKFLMHFWIKNWYILVNQEWHVSCILYISAEL